jgi:dynein light intermediate chain
LPPREYQDSGQLWVQYVSPTPATRVDVISLQDELDKKLQERQARETGICPIREELYAQAFDELIRQVTINCAERGFLLVRVRDEIKMTVQAYQTLYESSVAYGMRKALQAEQRRAEQLLKINHLAATCEDLEQTVLELKELISDRLL